MEKYTILHEKLSENPMQRMIICFLVNDKYNPDHIDYKENRSEAIGWVVDWGIITEKLMDGKSSDALIKEEIAKFRRHHAGVFTTMRKQNLLLGAQKIWKRIEEFITQQITSISKHS